MNKDLLVAPSKIPKEIKMVHEEEAPPSSGGGVFGGVGGGSAGGVFGGAGLATSAPKVAVSAPKGPQRVSSGVMAGNRMSGADPVYPAIAKSAHIQGHVIIDATISKTGTIENLQVVSGPPLLRDAALQAVRTWRYKPYMLSGEPTEVQTTIDVNFNFGGG
jgi:protein TonB